MADVEDLDSIPDHTHDRKNPLLMPLRIVLFALLAVAVVGLIVDQLARKNAQAAFENVNGAMGAEGSLEDVTRDQVHKLIGRDPDDDGDADDNFESFSWQGALKPQVLYVEYRPGTDHVLKDVSLNEQPPHFP